MFAFTWSPRQTAVAFLWPTKRSVPQFARRLIVSFYICFDAFCPRHSCHILWFFLFSTSLLIHVLAEQCRVDSAIPNMRHICIVKPFLGENANMKYMCVGHLGLKEIQRWLWVGTGKRLMTRKWDEPHFPSQTVARKQHFMTFCAGF